MHPTEETSQMLPFYFIFIKVRCRYPLPTYLPADIYCLSHFCVAGPVLQEKQGAAKYSGAVWPAKMWQIDEATCQKMGSKASLVY